MKVLEITSELDGGGVDRLLYDYCSRLTPTIHFDFIVTSETEGILEKPLIDLGCKVFHVSQFRTGLLKHISQVQNIINKGEYDIVHDHSGYKSFINLHIAKRNSVNGRIAHSHIANVSETKKDMAKRFLMTMLTKHYATDLFACGEDAAKWMWGNENVYIMTNAIDSSKFEYSTTTRTQLRSELNINDKVVLGNVSRFSLQKNHEYLLSVFKDYQKKYGDGVLVLVGRGELFEQIYNMVNCDCSIKDSVLFLGIRDDVHDLLNAMDVFVLPSLYEGLPVTMVEVQANGLPIIASETITKEIALNKNVSYLDIDNSSIAKWVDAINDMKNKRTSNGIIGTDYDINKAVVKLKEKYYSIGS